jgi:hypothetical protein
VGTGSRGSDWDENIKLARRKATSVTGEVTVEEVSASEVAEVWIAGVAEGGE